MGRHRCNSKLPQGTGRRAGSILLLPPPNADFRQAPTAFTDTSLLRAASYGVSTVCQIFRHQHASSHTVAQPHTSCTGTSLPDAASYSLRVMRSFLVVPLYKSPRGSLRATSCFSEARGAGVCRGPAWAE